MGGPVSETVLEEPENIEPCLPTYHHIDEPFALTALLMGFPIEHEEVIPPTHASYRACVSQSPKVTVT